MGDGTTDIAGIDIPSTNPVFLTVVGVHVLLGLACTVTGAIAMLSQKRAGRHPRNGTIYFWCLAGVFLTAAGLAAVRWAEDYHLFVLGALSFAAAYLGRPGQTAALAPLGQASHHRHGSILRFASDRVLRGQRQEPAALERASSHCILAIARGHRDSPDRPCPAVASAGGSAGPALIKTALCRPLRSLFPLF
jgi:hypothetical protein